MMVSSSFISSKVIKEFDSQITVIFIAIFTNHINFYT